MPQDHPEDFSPDRSADPAQGQSAGQPEASPAAFDQTPVRRVWHNQEWYFSVIDVIAALTGSASPRKYWVAFKARAKNEGFDETLGDIEPLKLKSADGKLRETDTANRATLLRISAFVPSPKVELFRQWLAQVSAERFDDQAENNTPAFDSIKQINPYGIEYWSARDLMPLLDYRNWREFEDTIKRAMIACEEGQQIVADHYGSAPKMVTLGSGSQRQIKDYVLSRLACYLIAQNGDPRKTAIALAQTYFAVSTIANELNQLRQQQEKRLKLRERVADGNKSLAAAAMQAGVLSRNFGTFQGAGYKGLYGGLNLEAIKAKKGIGPKEDLLDRAGLAELGANALRIGLTEQKLRDEGEIGEAQAIKTHFQIGQEIRGAIERTGSRMPEDLPAEPSIKPLLTERQRHKTRSLPPAPKAGQEGQAAAAQQLSLFEGEAAPSTEEPSKKPGLQE